MQQVPALHLAVQGKDSKTHIPVVHLQGDQPATVPSDSDKSTVHVSSQLHMSNRDTAATANVARAKRIWMYFFTCWFEIVVTV